MAKARKKETLTPEERLQAALVPDWEQPYKVPENWCWVRLTSLKNGDSGFFDGDWILSENMDPTGDIRLLQLSDIGIGEFLDKSNKHINEKSFKELACSELNEGDIMISRMAEPIARSCIVPKFPYKVITAVDVAVLRCNSHLVINQYINYICNTKWFTDLAFSLARGTTRVRITRKNLGEMPIPLPPLPEQQRIVDRIESLFAKLDEAKQKAQDALDSFETRKAAILHKAFTGELTAQWRKEHSVRMESWARHPLKDVTQIGSGGTPSRKNSQYYLGDILWVKTGEIYWNYIYDSEEKITEEAIANSSAKLYPAGTVLVAMYGQGLTRGRAAILGVPATTNQAVCALQPCDRLENRYLYYYFMANYWEYREKAVGGNQPNYSATMIGNWIINIPSVLEQAEIVRILDSLLAKEQEAKETAEAILEQIDLIKKSILARAFRGELGTNNPAEESAVELVKEVIQKNTVNISQTKSKSKRTVIPTEIKSVLSNANEEEIIKLLMKSAPKTVPVQAIMSISKKKFELMDALRNLEQKQIIMKNSLGEYFLKG